MRDHILARRRFLSSSVAVASVGLLAGCGLLPAQTTRSPKIPRIGYLGFVDVVGPNYQALLEGLRELGYIEGQNIAIERRSADGRLERVADMATELASLNLDVIMVSTPDAISAIQQASSTTPIVSPAFQDPVERGLVASLARPGGNVTGLAITSGLEAAKRLDLLKQAVPSITRVAILWDRSSAVRYSETVVAAQTLGLEHLSLGLEDTGDVEAVLARATTGRADGLMVMGSFRFAALAQQIVNVVARDRLPAMYSITTTASLGGLLAYAPNILENFRRAATYIDKILKGARPADLPIELPTTFDFIVNLKTAQAVGLIIPHSVLTQATELIQ